jgi:hypothetical protein
MYGKMKPAMADMKKAPKKKMAKPMKKAKKKK